VVKQPPINISYTDYSALKRNFSTPESSNFKKYSWDFGDGTQQGGRECEHPYTASGYFTVILTLTLQDDSTIQSHARIFVGPGTRYIPGHAIYGDEIWYAGGTYVVQDYITINTGASLTIEEGVEVQFTSGAHISVNGTLKATGTIFTAADEDSPWEGIYFGPGSDDSLLKDCVFEHAKGSTYKYYSTTFSSYDFYYDVVLYLYGSSPIVSGCTIKNVPPKMECLYLIAVLQSSMAARSTELTSPEILPPMLCTF
jgi:PKD repeat protein